MKIIKYTLFLSVFIIIFFSFPALAKLNRVYVIVNMDNAPIEILEFGKYYREDKDHISSVVEYKNKVNRDIVASAITMVYYDPFNEKEGGVKGIATNLLVKNDVVKGGWSIYGEPEFVKTAIAFVSAVRFEDGEVWRADLDEVMKKASKNPELEFLSQTKMLKIEKK